MKDLRVKVVYLKGNEEWYYTKYESLEQLEHDIGISCENEKFIKIKVYNEGNLLEIKFLNKSEIAILSIEEVAEML